MHIHSSFLQVASIQSYSLDHLLNIVTRRRDASADAISCAISKLEPLTNNFKAVSNTHDLPDAGTFKRYRDYQNSMLVLEHLKAKGVTQLKLDTGKDMHHQIIELAKKTENCPPQYHFRSHLEDSGEFTYSFDKRHTATNDVSAPAAKP